ncbi:F-box protein SKIP19 [Dendrobium catenatum]|uniref:F-box/LRR-repeat protein n=1 Tax=Dendrobium catenatum TaxID=906689 RepID=A0A2I0X7F9_9ASPA|nr:F-box protein SKIP19 [Dendrobium catenatum]PKU83855.1 F-box/LRR-repeat protein [Dendrobium catenatum]
MDHLSTVTNWEDMQLDCLSIIFSKLGLDDLTTSIPFVCKSWSQVSSHPFFYQVLDFRFLNLNPSSSFSKIFSSQYSLPRFTFSSFLKLAMAQSHGAAFDLRFSSLFPPSMEVLSLASITCPRLKTLCLPRICFDDEVRFFNLLSKWRDLEWLAIESKPFKLREMAEQIGIHCSKFYGMKIRGFIRKEDVTGIVDFLPKIEVLDLSGSQIRKEEVLAIVDGCRGLKRLSLKECVGFEADEEVSRRARGIQVFEFDRCRVEDGLRNSEDQSEVLEQTFMYFDDCFEMWMF